jgi:phenylpropionate dioxygenase-like ring-hydroxylating dioxygenase large terminal subunit
MTAAIPTLSRADYTSDDVYAVECRRVFADHWVAVGRADRLTAGDRCVVELPGESVLLTRTLDGQLNAFANSCRHRGARLCDLTGACAIVTTVVQRGPHHTTLFKEYLFAPETIAARDFSATPIVEFNELVDAQDKLVCENVHRGIAQASFRGGVLSSKEADLIEFNERYRRAMVDPTK